MDKYQKFLLSKYGKSFYKLFYRACPVEQEEQGSSIQYLFSDEKTNSITIKQDEDINITQYILILNGKADQYDVLSKVSVYKNKHWEEIELSRKGYRIIIDFNDRTEKIKLSFVNNLADDYILDIKYLEADKEKYYAKQVQQKKDSLLKTANIKHSTGNDLVNIYFQPCCDECEKTEISLYKDGLMLAKYKVEEGVFFKSIGGLAYGTYEYIVKQFDKDNKLLIETDRIKFSISRPNYGGKPTIVI